MKVFQFPILFWRFARLSRSVFPFWEHTDLTALYEASRSVLVQPLVSEKIERLLNRPLGHVYGLATAPTNSDHFRALRYATEVLMSLVIKHDLGKKGAVSLAHIGASLDGQPSAVTDAIASIPRPPERVTISRLDTGAFVAGGGAYELAVDGRERVILEESHLQRISDALMQIAESSANACIGVFGKRPYMIAVDGMFSDGDLDLFEVHVPGRSIGIHLLPLLWAMGMPRNCVMALDSFRDDFFSERLAATHLPTLAVPDTEFHLMDAMCLEWMFVSARRSQNINGVPVVPVFDLSTENLQPGRLSAAQAQVLFDRSFWHRQIGAPGNSSRAWTMIPAGKDGRALSEIEEYGPWVVLKANTNYPWWYKKRTPVWIGLSNDPRTQRFARNILGHDSLVVERLNATSVDSLNSTGEIRAFAVVCP